MLPDVSYDKNILRLKSLGSREKRVAILGAFDTWVLMHNVASILAKKGYVAITSRFIYTKNDHNDGYERYDNYPDDPNQTMTDFLQKYVIKPCPKAIILFSVPAAHYNEVEWCSKLKIDTLGIAFVREIYKEEMCPDCVVNHQLDYSYCIGEEHAWTCISKPNCPFKKQEIAKNILEYFSSNENINLIALEKLEKIDKIVELFMEGDLPRPTKKPFVFEYRIELTKDEFEQHKKKLDDLTLSYEEKPDRSYRFIDYYYKPINVELDSWLKTYTTMRVRDWRHPDKPNKEYVYGKIDVKKTGYVATHLFGSKILLKDNMVVIDEFNEDIYFKEFMRITKNIGYKYELKEPFPFFVYLEDMTVQFIDKERVFYSIEIELWIEDPKDDQNILEKTNIIDEYLGIGDKEKLNLPLQNIFYNFLY